MDAYKASFSSKQDVLIVAPDSDFFRFMKDSSGKTN
jgi:membrane protease subunit HflC